MARRRSQDEFLSTMTEAEKVRAALAPRRRAFGASYVPDVLTTKGDLLTRTSSGYARVPVGTDGQIVVADAADTEGLIWRDMFPTPTTVWDDVLGEIIPGLSVSAPTIDVYRDTPFRSYHFTHNQDDELHFRFQLSHRFKRQTECRLHIHFVPCVNPAADEYVVWEVVWAWSYAGIELPAMASWNTTEARSTIGTTDAFKQKITALVATTPTADGKESSILCARVRRLGSTAPATGGWSDTYTTAKATGAATANVMLLSCDLHYQVEKIGTTSEIPT